MIARLASNRYLSSCLLALGALVAIALAAPWLSPYDPLAVDSTNLLQGPSAEHLLGTDHLGRDVLSRVLYGARTALTASLVAVSIGMAAGVGIGLLIGYLGGWWDRIGTRIADVMQAIPALLLALAFLAVVGDGLVNAMVAVGIVFIDSYLRITRALVLREREMLYVDAGQVAGLRQRTLFRNILPNIAGPLVIHTSILLGIALLIEAALSFLGVGAQADEMSWGAMLEAARQHMHAEPLLAVFPGAAITLCVLLFNLLGDALNGFLIGGTQHAHPALSRHRSQVTAMPQSEVTPSVADREGALLDIRNLTVVAGPEHRETALVSEVSLSLRRGEIYGLVGESGCGKSVTASAIVGLLPPGTRVSGGSVRLAGTELLGMDEGHLREVRGARIGMVFQDPVSSLSPVHTIGRQLGDAVSAHTPMSKRRATDRAAELLAMVGVPEPRKRLADYPHQFSGGMAQRVVIAGALASEPDVLIADEPTTALDVTIQAQVLDLLMDLTKQLHMSALLITHDMGVVASSCDQVAVMYAGQIVEQRETSAIFEHPQHPYTEALLAAMPNQEDPRDVLRTIPGRVPEPGEWPAGCHFCPRCPYAAQACEDTAVPLVGGTRCVRVSELALEGVR